MPGRQTVFPSPAIALAMLSLLFLGCLHHGTGLRTPTSEGLNTNNLIDPTAQIDDMDVARFRERMTSATSHSASKRSTLCLSGGGAYGAYSVGVLHGWTQRGDRPCFDVVTGISTGALIAPFAFLGSSHDAQLQELYTSVDSRDIYRLKPVTGLFSESFASSRPLAKKIEELVTMEQMAKLANEHAKGRRLYVGTTEMEGHRFVVWDIGAIASNGRQQDLELIRKLLLASSSIPGIFPPIRIPVTVNGQQFTEFHVDGSVSQSVFFRPPVEQEAGSSQGTQVYVVLAGKLYSDPQAITPRSLTIAMQNLTTFSYAHCRANLFRIWSLCHLTGRQFHMTSIPEEFPAPRSLVDFDPAEMTAMFQEGRRQMLQGTAWRTTPPGMEANESTLVRGSADLIVVPRSNGIVNGR